MADKLESSKGEIATETALQNDPEALAAKARLTDLGHAVVDQTGGKFIGDIMDRLVGLDPHHAKDRHDVLEAEWASVAREVTNTGFDRERRIVAANRGGQRSQLRSVGIHRNN